MKMIQIIMEDGAFQVKGEKGKVEVNITEIHPEAIMENGSILIFDKPETYYQLIGDASLFIEVDSDINVNKLIENGTSDTVSNFSYKGYDVSKIIQASYQNGMIYYISRIIPEE